MAAEKTASRAWSHRGLAVITAYCLLLLVQVPFQIPPPERLSLGPLTLEGKSLIVGLSITTIVWIVMVVGLVRRRLWGYRLAIGVFVAHVLLVLLGAYGWWRTWGDGALRAAWPAVLWPSLQWLFTDALACIYLLEHREAFAPKSEPALRAAEASLGGGNAR